MAFHALSSAQSGTTSDWSSLKMLNTVKVCCFFFTLFHGSIWLFILFVRLLFAECSKICSTCSANDTLSCTSCYANSTRPILANGGVCIADNQTLAASSSPGSVTPEVEPAVAVTFQIRLGLRSISPRWTQQVCISINCVCHDD